MCGLLAYTGTQKIDTPLARLAHRGPDHTGALCEREVCLGHCRLSIIDVDERSNQPMRSTSGRSAIVFNGEIYNYRALHEELSHEGAVFRTQSDTEVLLEGYERHGTRFFDRLRGMWAFVLHDEANGKLIACRDPFGIKPLVYALKHNSIYFSSELRALKELISLEPDPAAFPAFYTFGYFPAPTTPYKGVFKVLPGEILAWKVADKSLQHIGRISRFAGELPAMHSFEDALAHIDRSLTESVEAHYVADVPVSMLLSGGTDSSLIAALSVKLGRRPGAYHIAVPGSGDTPYAEGVARHLGLKLEIEPLSQKLLERQYEKVWSILDEPTGDISIIPTSLVFEKIKGQAKVVLSGDGGDELFGGYLRHRTLAPHQKVTTHNFLNTLFNRLLLNNSFGVSVWNPLVERLRTRALVRGWTDDLVGAYLMSVRMMRAPIADTQMRQLLVELYEMENDPRIIPMLAFDTLSYLFNDILEKTDTASMAVSIEARVPFVDRWVVTTASSALAKYPTAGDKRLLKEVLAHYVPRELAFRGKMGFNVPMHAYDARTFMADFEKACEFHLANREALGVNTEFAKLLHGPRATLAHKYSRFAFALISNWKVIG